MRMLGDTPRADHLDVVVHQPPRTGGVAHLDQAVKLAVHRELYGLIEMRDAAGARRLMDDHVKMIRARRVAEHGHEPDHCC